MTGDPWSFESRIKRIDNLCNEAIKSSEECMKMFNCLSDLKPFTPYRKEPKGMNIIEAHDEARKQGRREIRREVEGKEPGMASHYRLAIVGSKNETSDLREFLWGCSEGDLRATNWEVVKVERKVEGTVNFQPFGTYTLKFTSGMPATVPDGAKVVITWEE